MRANSTKILLLFLTYCFFVENLTGAGNGLSTILVVNPGDENQMRIARNYQELYFVPDSHIVFVEPRLQANFHQASERHSADDFNFVEHYLSPIHDHITNKGLSEQIDYIISFGQPYRIHGIPNSSSSIISYTMATTYLNQTVADNTLEFVVSESYNFPRDEQVGAYEIGSNEALLNSEDGLYIGAVASYTGIFGNTPNEIINQLRRSAAANGSHPTGTIYFEENNNVRSNTREYQWDLTKRGLEARGIPYIEESSISGNTPLNRNDVRGAVIGAAGYSIPNGSVYLPGSWADSLTSFGALFDTPNQTKATTLIRAGAGGSSGTVTEPYAIPSRFPNSHIFLYLADGSTIGEAFYKATAHPFLQLLLGDPLSQPYADIPTISVVSDSDLQNVQDTVVFDISTALIEPKLATAVESINCYVDGKLYSTHEGGKARIEIDSSTLQDGYHQLHFAAYNNTLAKSSKVVIESIMVNNSGYRVFPTSASYSESTRNYEFNLKAVTSDVDVVSVGVKYLGKTLTETLGSSGQLLLPEAKIAYGTNAIQPFAVLADGSQLLGKPFKIQRNPRYVAAQSPQPISTRFPGIKVEYYFGKGSSSISQSDYSGIPDRAETISSSKIAFHEHLPVAQTNNLAVKLTTRFVITSQGEYHFFLIGTNDSAQLDVGGVNVLQYDGITHGLGAHYAKSTFLSSGEHTLQLLLANVHEDQNNEKFNLNLYMRGPDGVTQILSDSFCYYTAN